VALLQLQEEGKLSLDDKLAKYYPAFPRAADITLTQLLHHTSGLHDYVAEPTFDKGDELLTRTTQEWIEHFAKMPKLQDFEPGSRWSYSNTGYYLLGGVIEKIEGQSLAAVFKHRFFARLGMEHTALDDEYEVVRGRAAGYDADAQGKFRNALYISMTAVGAAGAVRSTASDLVRWNQALFGGKLLKPASLRAMLAPGKLNNGKPSSSAIKGNHLEGGEYGYGIVITKLDGHLWMGHAGGIHGFTSLLAEFPDDRMTVAVIANSIGGEKGAGKAADRIRRLAVGLAEKK
jgi:CubicO group peptidase (beta-lactamase class C family)